MLQHLLGKAESKPFIQFGFRFFAQNKDVFSFLRGDFSPAPSKMFKEIGISVEKQLGHQQVQMELLQNFAERKM